MRIIFQIHQFSLDINQCENDVGCLLQGPPTTHHHPALSISAPQRSGECCIAWKCWVTSVTSSHHSLGSVGGAWFPITQQSYSHQLTVPWYSIKRYNSAFDNRRIILLAWVQCNKRWRGQPGSNLGNDSVCRRRCHSNITVEDSLVEQYTFGAKI